MACVVLIRCEDSQHLYGAHVITAGEVSVPSPPRSGTRGPWGSDLWLFGSPLFSEAL